MKRAIIIGGGPAGLTAAYELAVHTDIQPLVFEKTKEWGGISKTLNYKGNRIDIGGHRFFSKSDVVMDWWFNIMPVLSEDESVTISYQNKQRDIHISGKEADKDSDNVFLVRKRKSRIFYLRQFFDYPISMSLQTFRNLGMYRTAKIGFSYVKSVVFPIKNEKNLEDFFINRFGNELYRTFFKDYTEKVWGTKCEDISSEWGAQRIKGLSVRKTISHMFSKLLKSPSEKNIRQKETETSLIEYFLYPKYGPGQMWENVAEIVGRKGGILEQNSKICRIHIQDKKVIAVTVKNETSGKEEYIPGDYFLSTMPMRELINVIDADVPQEVKEIANGLQYRDFITVGLLLDKMILPEIEDNWIYIQERDVKVGRIQFFNNWSPYMLEDSSKIWIGMEYFCNEGDDLWNLEESEMKTLAVNEMVKMKMIKKDQVLDSVVIKMEKAYPAYFGSYNQIDKVIDYVSRFDNLYLIGRNGMHKYNNQDHSMLTAIEAVNNIKNNITDKSNIWSINTEQDYHEEHQDKS